jgi:tripartite-type tricarboxylate transporter receptor subunit TctC
MGARLRCLTLLLLMAASGFVQAQSWPNKPVRIIVAFGAGGSVDVLARIVGQKLSEAWGQPVVIDNRVGAGGNIATETVAKAPADGHTLLFHTSAIALNAGLYANLPFNTAKDLAPIMKVASTNGVFVVPLSVPAHSVKELVALAKAQPGKLAFASTGSGSSSHLFMALFMAMTGIEVVHVPYKNISQMYTDFIPGRTQMSISTLPSAMPHIQAGKIRVLAVTGGQRSESLRDVPTMQEAGFPSYEASTWYGAFAPAGTPAQIVGRINADIQRLLALAEVKQRFASVGLDPQGGTADQFEKYFLEEIAKWGQVVKTNGLQAE